LARPSRAKIAEFGGRVKKFLKILGWTLLVLIVLAGGVYGWLYQKASARLHQHWDVAGHDFPIPFPLREDELAALRADRVAQGANADDPLAGIDLDRIATERAVTRGQHLVESRLMCAGCHGADFGGNTIVDVAVVGHWVAPNLTSGEGSVTRAFTARDWDKAVRHGIKHTGETSSMPSSDFLNVTDRELSDVVAYIKSRSPVNRDMGTVRLGPVFAYLTVTDPNLLAAFTMDHAVPHAAEPPAADVPSVELGQHIAQVCKGCHGPGLSGGKLAGDPNMPIVANLTAHETGLKGWTEADFLRALREGKRKDGSAISETMPWKAFGQMGDTELKALWAYIQTMPAREKGNH
jgi:mono/diheme cytochrome c family protein